MKVPNNVLHLKHEGISLSRLQNEGSQRKKAAKTKFDKSIKATE